MNNFVTKNHFCVKMPCILSIETSTKVCSLALSVGDKVLLNKMQIKDASHASLLGVYAYEAMEFVRKNNIHVDAVAVSSGPGSYTGLRIGVSEAKGLCYGLDIPLIAIPSLKVLTESLLLQHTSYKDDILLCPMIDARRMEVYSALYDVNLNEVRSVGADIIDAESYKEYLEAGKVIYFGDGSAKCKDVITSHNALFVDDIYPMASAMTNLAATAYSNKDFVDVAYFEPFYLKEFQATVAKNKVINPT
ncbi:tRNA threonylcarbamoyladenosine biosynthesis protein TsaB [Dysgonomonadaceae bacterium PH5-43]|nr:tRNA threonylcarbamoyladenosine biosynthesis protein TsaB [Dysgonomonadaceae bacterium PH5-43]